MSVPKPATSKLVLESHQDQPRKVLVDPWAADYIIFPGERLEIEAEGDGGIPWFIVDEYDHTIWVHLENTSSFVVSHDGKPVDPGWNREPLKKRR
jgi:hypothetical protein